MTHTLGYIENVYACSALQRSPSIVYVTRVNSRIVSNNIDFLWLTEWKILYDLFDCHLLNVHWYYRSFYKLEIYFVVTGAHWTWLNNFDIAIGEQMRIKDVKANNDSNGGTGMVRLNIVTDAPLILIWSKTIKHLLCYCELGIWAER